MDAWKKNNSLSIFLHKDGLLYRLKSLIVFDMLNYFLLTALALNTGLQSQ